VIEKEVLSCEEHKESLLGACAIVYGEGSVITDRPCLAGEWTPPFCDYCGADATIVVHIKVRPRDDLRGVYLLVREEGDMSKAMLRVERAWPGWTWRFTGGPDKGHWSTTGWAWTHQGAEIAAFEYIGLVAEVTKQPVTLKGRKDYYS
jgi:hypothetical protein